METALTPLEFARRARKLYAGREAVVYGSLRLNYQQFFDQCDRGSAALQRLGVRQGDRVAGVAPNTHAQLESFYAVPQVGAVTVPINHRLTAHNFMQSTTRAAILASLICGFAGRASSATIASQSDGDTCRLVWQGDERIEISFSRRQGLLNAPVSVRVDNRSFSFDGFYVAFSGERDGYVGKSVSVETGKDSFRVTHLLEHPRLPSPMRVVVRMSVSESNKAVRFAIDTDNGERLHLDRLGIGNHHGAGLSPTRMFVTRFFVFEPPIEPFKLKYNYNCLRYWCFTMQNGITEMVGSDATPRGFDFDDSTGSYDVHTYCDTHITYTFVFTGKGPPEAMAHYRSTIQLPAPPTLSQLPGRVTVMTGYPIRERYEDFLDELTGRGVRDFIWLAYAPWPGDRKRVEPYGALYSLYDTYTDLFPEGPRKAEGWTPEWVRYESPGVMKRGYWDSTRCLPNLYIAMANGLRRQGTLGRELANRNFLRTPITGLYNLKIFKEKVKPTALYLDVHASLLPEHYYDFRGKHYPLSEHLAQEQRFFEWTRKFLGNVPVFSEVDCEPFAGIMDAGIFSPWKHQFLALDLAQPVADARNHRSQRRTAKPQGRALGILPVPRRHPP